MGETSAINASRRLMQHMINHFYKKIFLRQGEIGRIIIPTTLHHLYHVLGIVLRAPFNRNNISSLVFHKRKKLKIKIITSFYDTYLEVNYS